MDYYCRLLMFGNINRSTLTQRVCRFKEKKTLSNSSVSLVERLLKAQYFMRAL